MGVGGVVAGDGSGKMYEGHVTGFVIITCIVAASGGLIFGYDIGISGTCFSVIRLVSLGLRRARLF